MERTKSSKLYEEAKNLFPGGVNSPVRAFKSVDGPPIFISHANGCKMTDVDGNSFIDFCCSWGPLILGHNNDNIREAIKETVDKGASFGTPTAHGNEIGKLILDHHRFIDKIRFVSSGTEAVMSAIRLARGVTGKDKILKFDGCYHGHVDSLLVKAGSGLATFGVSSSAGVTKKLAEDTLVIPLNDVEILRSTIKEHHQELAAVIIEPIPANNGLLLQTKAFLESLRTICTEYHVLLIFDEVISGFRAGFEGAAGRFDIQPDIITFGKIIGGGMPVGAYGASNEIMAHIAPDGPVYQAGTLSANPVTIAAGIAALKQLLAPNFYQDLEEKTKSFVNAIIEYANENNYPLKMQTIASIFWFNFGSQEIIRDADSISSESMDKFKILHSELLKRNVYLGPSGYEVGFISSAHSEEDLTHALSAIKSALDIVYGN